MFELNPTHITNIIPKLQELERNSGKVDQWLKVEDLTSNDDSVGKLQISSNRATAALRQWEELSSTLEELAGSVRSMSPLLRSSLHSVIRKHGLYSIPNEIFAKIFDLACNGFPKTNFQLLCRRFRQYALSRPELWVDVNDSIPPFHIAQRLSRCADLAPRLSATLLYRQNPLRVQHCTCKQWSMFRRHASRFVEAKITLNCGVSRREQAVPEVPEHMCISRLRHIRWSSLTSLVLESQYDSEMILYFPHLSKPLETALMPNLRYFECNLSQLLMYLPRKSRQVKVHCNIWGGRLCINSYIGLFLSNPIAHPVECFQLSLVAVRSSYDGYHETVTVPNLKHFTVRILHQCIGLTGTVQVKHVLRYIHAPNLERLQVSTLRSDFESDDFIEWLSMTRCLSLKKVGIGIFEQSGLELVDVESLKARIRACYLSGDGSTPDISFTYSIEPLLFNPVLPPQLPSPCAFDVDCFSI